MQELGFDKLYEAQQAVLSVKDPWIRLRKHGNVYVSFALDNPEYYDLMFIMRAPVKKMKEKKTWEAGLRSYRLLRDNVQACLEAGVLKKTHPDAATFAFWSLTHGIASLVIRERCIMYPEEHMQSIINGALDFVMENMAHNVP